MSDAETRRRLAQTEAIDKMSEIPVLTETVEVDDTKWGVAFMLGVFLGIAIGAAAGIWVGWALAWSQVVVQK